MAGKPNPSKSALWQQLFAEFDTSSMTVTEFCKFHRCSVASFYQWRSKLRTLNSSADVQGRSKSKKATKSAFVPIKLDSSASALWPLSLADRSATAPVVALLANGTKLELACDPLAALVSILQHQEPSRSC